MDDRVISPSVAEFVRRLVPGATVHKLLDEGHFSYFCFCDECHRQIFSTLFGIPQGPMNPAPQPSEVVSELNEEITVPDNVTDQEQGKSGLPWSRSVFRINSIDTDITTKHNTSYLRDGLFVAPCGLSCSSCGVLKDEGKVLDRGCAVSLGCTKMLITDSHGTCSVCF